MRKLFVALTMFVGALAAFAELRISEICPRPNGMDPNGRQSGWIELYNDGSEAVDLADYEIVRANRGKALMPVGRPLASRTLAAKAYTVVYTSDEYDNADSGEVKIYANDMMVYPKKVSPKKFPFVALYKGSTLIDRFVVPVDLPDNQSVAPAGGAFTEYKGSAGGTGLADKWHVTDKAKVTRVILPVITKGAANNRTRETAYGPNVGPLYGLAHDFTDLNPTPPAKPGKPYTVTLAINPAADAVNAADAEIASVKLITRTWSIPSSGEDKDRQKTPTQTTGEYVMTKSSSSAGQGQLWTATIPAADLPEAGQLIQWATVITEASGNSYRSPSYRNVKDGYQWYGTIVEPTSAQLSQTLQTWHVFGDANAVSYMDFGNEDYARFGIYDSQTSTYYDNVYLSGRGNSSKNYSKKSHSLKFSKVHPMRCTNSITGEELECRKTSLLAEYCDMSRVRSSLSMMVRREAGQDVPFGYPIRTQLNGLFYQLAHHSNRFTDELLTDYYGYDKYGVAFKNVGNAAGESSGGSGNNGAQVLPDDGTSQLACYTAFKAGIAGAGNYTYDATGLSESDSNTVNRSVVEYFDLPYWLNFLALSRFTQECDDGWSNLCLYYDRNGNGAWRPLAYDLHQSFGVYYYGDGYGSKREIWADDDKMKCHPLYGGCHVVSYKKRGAFSYGNRAYEAVYQNAKYRRLHNRRLRTLMDTILMPPGTSRENTPLWKNYVKPMVDAQIADDLLDRERWGSPDPMDSKSMIYCWDRKLTFAEGVEDLWDNYIVKRRNHFYNTHSITNTSFEGGYAWNKNAQIPLAQSPISALKAKFSATPVPGGVVIRNLNEETVDMSGWKLAGTLNFTFPAGTVIDQAFGSTPGEIFVVTDRINYIAGLEQSGTALTDQVILGNAANGTKTGCGLWTADGVEVVAGPAPEEPEPDKPEKTVFSGVYDEPVEITADASYVFSNATLNAGLVIADGVTAKLNSATNTVNKISTISAANAEVRFTGDGTMKLEGSDTLATVRNLLVKSGTLQVKSTGVSATKKPVINVLGFVEQTGGVIDMNLDVATTNQIYGIYVANKNVKDAEGNDTVYALFDGGRFNAVVGAGKSAALYVNKGSADTTFKGGEILGITLKGTEPRFANVAGKLEFKRVEVKAAMPEACGSVTGARVFKSDKSIVFSDAEAHFDVNVQGPDAEIFSAADRITVDAGVFELVASDDCFSATTNITVNGGLVYAVSTENDVFDSNGDMELNGGTILAYTTAGGHEAFDVDPELVGDNDLRHQLRVNGGTIFATGGKNSAWPEDFVTPDGFVLYSAEDLAASDVSGKYASLKSTIDMITTAKLPVFTDTKCALLMTCPNMTGEPTFSASAPSSGSQDFHDLYIEMKGETNQSALRFLEIYGSTVSEDGDVGEYIVLTNPTAKVIQLGGVTVSIAKNDVKKGKIDDPKCLITLGVGTLPAYGSVRLDQADYSGAGWSKITNGNIFLKLTDALGNVVQSGYASFDNAKYADVDGKGASLIAVYFGTSLTDTDECWCSSRETEPEPPPHEHSWGTPTYSWSADGKSCTATRACTGCTEKETETVTATFVTTKEATTEATGLGHYEASFKNSAFAKQSGADVTIPKKEQQEDPGTGGGDEPIDAEGDYYVSLTGSDSNNGTSPESAFATIAHAVEVAAAGKTVCVLAGTYELTDTITISKAITVTGEGWEKTIFKQTKWGKRCVLLDNGAKLVGVTLTGGNSSGNYEIGSGAGAQINNGTISWCCISNNYVASGNNAHGTGVLINQGTIDHSIIADNRGGNYSIGGGIGAYDISGPVVIDTCLIYGNTAKDNGGGIGFAAYNGDVTVRNCTITGNSSEKGNGGLWVNGDAKNTKTLVMNTIISGNTVAGVENNTSSPFKADSAGNLIGGTPKFVDAANGDYHLAEGSAAIGAGVTYSGIGKDLDGKSFASNPSVGCYEYGTAETVDWDHPEVTIAAGVTAGTAWSALKNSVLDAADAAKLQAWAKNVGKVAFESAGDIKVEAFLLNCANTDAAIAAAKAEFKFTSFDPEQLPTASDFADKGYNGVVTIEGRAALDSGDWATAKTGDKFFRAILSL